MPRHVCMRWRAGIRLVGATSFLGAFVATAQAPRVSVGISPRLAKCGIELTRVATLGGEDTTLVGAAGFALGPDGLVYVSNDARNYIGVYDRTSGRVLRTI